MQRGDVRGVSAVEADLAARDDALGQRRRGFVASLAARLRAMVERTAFFRLALDHYALVRGPRLQYERRVRPVLAALDGAAPVLARIRDMNGASYQRLEDTEKTLSRLRMTLDAIVPPDGLAAVHATLASALRMAEQACAKRREAVVTTSLAAAREASSAASGAILLSTQARGDLVTLLYAPRPDAVR
jgi:restriction endonuclease Mrr